MISERIHQAAWACGTAICLLQMLFVQCHEDAASSSVGKIDLAELARELRPLTLTKRDPSAPYHY